MGSFEIIPWIYNQALHLMVTPLDIQLYRFKVEAARSGGNSATILKYLPNRLWVAGHAAMKCFTKEYIHQVGKLIELKIPELF